MAELDDIRLEDVFDIGFLQKFQDTFARAVGMTAVTVDKDGKPVAKPALKQSKYAARTWTK